MFNPADIQKGMTARDRDGEPLGAIVTVDARGFTIGKGGAFTKDYTVAFSGVTDLDGDDVYLREDLASLPGASLAMGRGAWGHGRRAEAPRAEATGALSAADRGAWGHGRRAEAPRADEPREVPLSHDLTGGLGLSPRDLEEARMDSAKFQDHRHYHMGGDEDDTVRREAPTDLDPNTRR